MEEKRILWVSAAVGIFLLIVVGAALVLYAPQKNDDPVSGFAQEQGETSWVLTPQVPGVCTENPQSQSQTQPSCPESVSVLPSDTAAQSSDSGETGTIQNSDLTIISSNTTVFAKDKVTTIDLTSGKAIEQQVVDCPVGTETAREVKTVVPVKTENSSAKAQTAKKSKVRAKSVASKSGAKTKAKTRVVSVPDRFWVQAAAFTDKDNAESARSVLANEKIPAEVFTYQDKNGKTYYRLRVGPYTTESEAQYWNSRIKLIDHFGSAQSYVTNSSKPLR